MGILIDSSVLIDHERRGEIVRRRATERDDEEFMISVVTASELLHGVHRARDAGTRARRSAFVEAVIERFPILAIDLPTARTHAHVWAELASAGNPIGAHDLWIGAACIAHGLTLVTANRREFERIPGLELEEW